ncbi:MAG: fasciclin domain-containing protein [Flavobacteriaceae bacterium]
MKSTLVLLLLFSIVLTGCKNNQQSEEATQSEASSTETSSSNKGQAFIEDESAEPNALRVAINSPDHTTLVAAVQAAEVENSLVNVGPLTVFAPTNAAFDKIDKATLDNLLKPENKDQLALILKHHVAPGNYPIDMLERSVEKGRNLGMASNQSIDVTKEGDDIYVGGAKIIGTVKASNGWVHVVEDVILPQN